MRIEANQKLTSMMASLDIVLPETLGQTHAGSSFNLVLVDDCFFRELPSVHIRSNQFEDKTGFECFNHTHLPASTRTEVLSVLESVSSIASTLRVQAPTEAFRIIAGLDGNEATVRFHKVRQNEQWLAQIDSYTDEGILLVAI